MTKDKKTDGQEIQSEVPFSRRAVVSWNQVDEATKTKIQNLLSPLPFLPFHYYKPILTRGQIKTTWTNKNLTCWCPIAKVTDFHTLEIEYEPESWVLEHFSGDEYVRCFRNISITAEELLSAIVYDFEQRIQPRALRVVLVENNVDDREVVRLEYKTNNWKD